MRRSTTWYQKPVGSPSASPANSMNRPMVEKSWRVMIVMRYPRRPIAASATRRRTISCIGCYAARDLVVDRGAGVGVGAVDTPRYPVEAVGGQALLLQAGADLVDGDLAGVGCPVGQGDLLHGVS